MNSRREKSLRADARRRYVEMSEQEQRAALARGGATPLTDHVRALYEAAVVPVREIARLAGVTERTLYKYVQKGGWRRRYAVRGVEAAAANRGRGLTPGPGLAPAKGAGGRFIAREDAGKPHAQGLKAIDPEGARQAVTCCVRAAARADDAVAAAKAEAQARRAARQAEKQADAQMRAYEVLCAALIDLARAQAEAGAAWSNDAQRLSVRLHAAIAQWMARLRADCGARAA